MTVVRVFSVSFDVYNEWAMDHTSPLQPSASQLSLSPAALPRTGCFEVRRLTDCLTKHYVEQLQRTCRQRL
jgi:hypothetical protein